MSGVLSQTADVLGIVGFLFTLWLLKSTKSIQKRMIDAQNLSMLIGDRIELHKKTVAIKSNITKAGFNNHKIYELKEVTIRLKMCKEQLESIGFDFNPVRKIDLILDNNIPTNQHNELLSEINSLIGILAVLRNTHVNPNNIS